MTDISELFSLAGRTALVTGASSGLGRHFARVLHDAGASVVLAARRVDRIEADARAFGERASALRMDVADEASIVDGFEQLAKSHPPIDILVNNAGISGSNMMLQMETQEWDDVVAVNLRAPFLVAREAARRLVAAKTPGSIINIASILGMRVAPALAPYMASKAGLIHLTQSMALEFARYKIRVNAICPGYFDTEINSEFLQTEYAQAMIKRTPQRRVGDLKDLTGPLLLLASNAGAYMTGTAIVVDGGQNSNSL
ncbi:MAG: 2-deoxy-D-gluconate 3-dehydrogenase [Candidatus Eremiobacteraeota bacterium]|jgi:NAD(P)-dependent dehydrogenase (short-subunit alcohol dehydrogenase family)|nr:2-deoxy-D-gluconate 3-dehydrogenase [Candidatus Eremiobacteraeota bacterium]